jgi:hypothetical protein
LAVGTNTKSAAKTSGVMMKSGAFDIRDLEGNFIVKVAPASVGIMFQS